MKKKMDDILRQYYANARRVGSFSSVENLYQAAKKDKINVTRKQVRDFLSSVDSYTFLKPKRYKFKRNQVIATSPNSLHMADLADMQKLQKWNDGYRFLLIIVDAFSKRMWVVPVKKKNSQHMKAAFSEAYSDKKIWPRTLQTDHGTEFYNRPVQELFKSMGIKHFSTQNAEVKASMAERAVRTLKQKIFKYLLHNLTRHYTDVLPDLVETYNNTKHRSIGMAPNEVTPETNEVVFKKLYPDFFQASLAGRKDDLTPGSSVRISKERGPFHKAYLATWSEEIFKIKDKLIRDPPVYRLETAAGELVQGTFYKEELQKVRPTDVYRVEKIIGQRFNKKTGVRQLRVQWQGHKDPSWINQSDLVTAPDDDETEL